MPKKHLSRREFTLAVSAAVGGVMGLVVGLPALGYLIGPALKTSESEGWVPLGSFDQIPVGVPTLYTFSRTKVNGWERTVSTYGVYILITEDNQLLALSNICTHLGCRVSWKEEEQYYACPCHAGFFDVEGNIIDGPQPRPLDSYPIKVDEEGMVSIYYGAEEPPAEEDPA
ncbi:MAG: ubiquinol-cytochrome c reductase iron-sulfur subunit [Chloroflexota bacterium]